jgi:hypothetical protein
MHELFLFSFLVRADHCLSRFVAHQDSANRSYGEARRIDLLTIDQRQSKPVAKKGSKILHQIECQRWAAGPIPMEEPHLAVEADRFCCGTRVVDE